MFSRPQILVCTDFSNLSDKALSAAADLGRRTRGELHLLHVAEINFYTDWGNYGLNPVENRNVFNELVYVDIKRRLKDQIEKCQVRAESEVQFGANAHKVIEKRAQELKADLIVVGSRGASGLERVLLGSLTRKFAFHSEIPLLVIKGDRPLDSFAGLVSGDQDLKPVLNMAQELSLLYSSRLNIISIFPRIPGLYFGAALEYSTMLTPDLEADREKFITSMQGKIKEALGKLDARVTVTSAFDVPKAIMEKLEAENISTVVLKRSQKTLAERFFDRSVSAALLEDFKGHFFIC